MTMTNTIETIQATIGTLQQACRALAGVCDGAVTEDGKGFNGRDTHFGKSLAAQSFWSPKQTMAAQKMLTTYKNQLLGYGIDISALPKVTLEELESCRVAKPEVKECKKVDDSRKAELREGRVHLYFPFSYDEKDAVKAIVGAKFEAWDFPKHWSVPVNERNAVAVRDYLVKYGYNTPNDVIALLLSVIPQEALMPSGAPDVSEPKPEAAEPTDLVAASYAEDADVSHLNLKDFQVDLFPFQRAGVAYAVKMKRAIIGDDMGLGKTFQAIAAVEASGQSERFVVVCPASVKINWARAIAKALPKVSTSIWNGKAGSVNVNCIIVNYDNLAKHVDAITAFAPTAYIFDEMHYLKNQKAKRTVAAKALAKGCEYVFGLTGTPVENRPAELISLLDIMDRLSDFGGWFQFAKRYCAAFKQTIPVKTKYGRKFVEIWNTSGASNLSELHDKLRSVCMIRRMKSQVLTDLPAKVRSQVVFQIDNRKAYNECLNNLKAFLAAGVAEDKAFAASLKGLSAEERKEAVMIRQQEVAESADRAEHLVMIENLKQLATAGKMAQMKEWIADFVEADEPLLVFATHIEAQKALLAEFPQAARIMAEDSAEVRQANVDKFRKGETKLMIASLIAGGTGIDGMQEVCSNVAFAELGWKPAVHLQAEDRLNRIGSKGQTTAWYLVAEDTIEETIQNMLAAKQAVCDAMLDGADETREGSIFNELLATLA